MKVQHRQEHLALDTFGATANADTQSPSTDEFLVGHLQRTAKVAHASSRNLEGSDCSGDLQASMFLVAEGVQGRPGAGTATGVVLDQVMDSALNAIPWSPELDLDNELELRRGLSDAVERCDVRLNEAAESVDRKMTPAATMTLAFVRWPYLFLVHVGHSRAYLKRGDHLHQLTTDHSLAQRLIEQGGEAMRSKLGHFKSVLWNAVGAGEPAEPELSVHRLHPGDRLLLCTHSLTGVLSDRTLSGMLRSEESASETGQNLLRTAREIDASKDYTLTLARYATSATVAASSESPTRQESAAIDPGDPTRPKEVTEPSLQPAG